MKTAFLLFAIVFISVSFTAPCRYRKGLAEYELVVKYNGTYCAGAKPPAEMIEEIRREKILESTTIKIFPVAKKKPVYKVKTGADGKCKVNLPYGKWNYTLTTDIGKEIMYINKKCSKAITKVYGTFTTDSSTGNTIDLLYHFECDPCDPNSKRRQ